MKTFQKIFLGLLLVIFLSILVGGFCLAQRKLETIYPAVPGVQTPMTTKTALPDYLRYVFTFAIIISGLVAFGAMIYGGFLYLTSAGDPSKLSNAKDQVIASFLGLIIILSSFLILNTINPQLVLPTEPLLEPASAGIYAYVKGDCFDETDNVYDDPVLISEPEVPDLSERLPKDQDNNPQSLQCIKFLSKKEDLTVLIYPEKEYGGDPKSYEDDPGQTLNVTGASMKLNYHYPGVYLYASKDCKGEKYGEDYVIYQTSSATLPEFNDKTRSIKFLYGDKDPKSGKYRTQFAAILHEHENFMGKAMLYDQDQGDANCRSVPDNLSVSSITVYLKPMFDKDGNEIIVGQGVRLWGDKNYTKEKDEYVLPSETEYYGNNTEVPDIEKKTKGSNDKISSIWIDGHYVALLFEDANYGGKCEVFMVSDPDLRNNPIGQCGFLGRVDCLSSFIVKARK
jgi:hypothetical protein